MTDTPNRPHLLIIEDDKTLSLVLQRKFSDENFKVSLATTGEEALAAVKGENKPDLALLDILLPGLDGFEVLKRIKEDPATKDIRVIILSNLGQKEEVERGIKLGAEKYMVKLSHSLNEVVAVVRSVWQGKHP